MIPIAMPLLGEDEAEAAAGVVRSGWLSQGAQVAAFEREFAEHVGAPYACAVSNCTTALHLALLVADVGPGDEVITASHSFIATANVIRSCGATPVFVDVEPRTRNIDPSLIEASITSRTRAVLCVHQAGLPCDLARILPLAKAHSVPVIEDAACAAGSEIRMGGRWEAVGAPHGDVACFSFHPRKVITTGEGGMLTTKHGDWDARFRMMRQHGMSVADTVRHRSSRVIFEEYPVSGFNYRMTDMQAAIGRQQLQRLDDIVARRRALAAAYALRLANVPVDLPGEPEWARTNWQSYSVGLPPGADQARVMQTMLDAGVTTRRGIMCSHLEGAYADAAAPALPHSEAAHRRRVLLPLYPQMTAGDQAHVVGTLKAALRVEPAGLTAARQNA